MAKQYYAVMLGALSLLGACTAQTSNTQHQQTIKDTVMVTPKDDHTLSNADSVALQHLELDIKVDFDHKQIAGNASWTIDNKNGQKELRLDTYDLTIDSTLVDGKKVDHKLDSLTPHLGNALHIPIEAGSKKVTVFYKTGDDARALQWLQPQQTDSKTHPFLYTQSEAINARSWVPCADGPGIRFTYDARVTVPKALLALMSAENPQALNDSGVYHFKMDKPIPAYLMALAVGDIRFKKIDERTGVYAEPTMIDKAAWELADMGKMVTTAEKLYGPYRWGRYDVLIAPPGFPIGGMENPKLTFATPTIIAGDRSLVNLIAHELAHNWSGNLVTNATWEDIWMNEGFTVYFERRITEAMTDRTYVDMLWELGYQDLEKEIAVFGKDSRDTWLKLDLKGRDPDDGLSDIPYEKGSLFLWLIEQNVSREKFDAFLKQYFDEHAFHSITTEQFLAYLREHLIKGDSTLEKKLDINAWVYGPGIPANAPRADKARFKKVDEARDAFLKGGNPVQLETKNWTSHEWQYFLRGMPETLTVAQMQQLDGAFHFTQTGNSEIADLWFVASLHANYAKAYPAMEQFLSKVGRQKFLEPLYGTMIHTGKKDMAKQLFDRYKQNYHPLAQAKIGKIVAGS